MTEFNRVYFISDGTAIKIGVALNVTKRLGSLQTGHHRPLTVLATIPEEGTTEYDLHQRFAHLRISGEWFRPEPELTDFIQGLKDSPPPELTDPPIALAEPAVKSPLQELRDLLVEFGKKRPDMQPRINTLDWYLKARIEGTVHKYPNIADCARMALDSIAGTFKWERDTGVCQLALWRRMYPDVAKRIGK